MKIFRIYALYFPILWFTTYQCDKNSIDPLQTTIYFEPGLPIRVGPENFNSTFSYYNTTPESPDGTMISYVKILSPQNERYDMMSGELWICNADLTGHTMVASQLNGFYTHNGVQAQWIDNHSIAYFSGGYIRVVSLEGEALIPAIQASSIGHAPYDKKILYSRVSEETNYSTIYEYDISHNEQTEIANVATFSDIVNHFSINNIKEMSARKILHLMYSPNGSKIALRLDVGDDGENGKHVITMNKNSEDIKYFGPKPMHFSWYDNSSIMGQDNQIIDGFPDNKSTRRWSLNTEFIETLAGPGNHLAASSDRNLFASESWYNENPVILSVFKRGQTIPFWQDTVSDDDITVWELGNHVNPSFSRDGKRVYYHKNIGFRQSQAYMVVLP